jgi:hypothetical protein
MPVTQLGPDQSSTCHLPAGGRTGLPCRKTDLHPTPSLSRPSELQPSLQVQAPAALRSAGRASRLRSGRRSCLRPAPPGLRRRAPTCESGRAMSREPRSAATLKACLRRGRRPRVPAGVVACAGSSHPVCHRPRQSRADAAPGVQVVRTVARSTWTPGTTPAPGVWVDGRRDGS